MYDLIQGELAKQENALAYKRSPIEQVKDRISSLETQLTEQKELLELLQRNPEFERMLNLMRR